MNEKEHNRRIILRLLYDSEHNLVNKRLKWKTDVPKTTVYVGLKLGKGWVAEWIEDGTGKRLQGYMVEKKIAPELRRVSSTKIYQLKDSEEILDKAFEVTEEHGARLAISGPGGFALYGEWYYRQNRGKEDA